MEVKDSGQSSAQTDLGLPVDKSEKGSSFNTIPSSSSREHSPELTTTDPSSDGYPDSPTLGTPPRDTHDGAVGEANDGWGCVDERARHIAKGKQSAMSADCQGDGEVLLRRASRILTAPRAQYQANGGAMFDDTSMPPLWRHEPLILKARNKNMEKEEEKEEEEEEAEGGDRPTSNSAEPFFTKSDDRPGIPPESPEDGDYDVAPEYGFVRGPPTRSLLRMMETITEYSEESESFKKAASSQNSPAPSTPASIPCGSKASQDAAELADDDRLNMQAYVRAMELMAREHSPEPSHPWSSAATTAPSPPAIQIPPRRVHCEPSMGSIASVLTMSTNLSTNLSSADPNTVSERLKQEFLLASRSGAGGKPSFQAGFLPQIDTSNPFALFASRSNSLVSNADTVKCEAAAAAAADGGGDDDPEATPKLDSLASKWYIPPKSPDEKVLQFLREYPNKEKGKEKEEEKGEIKTSSSAVLGVNGDGPPRIDIPILSERGSPTRYRRRQRSSRRLGSQTSSDTIGSMLARIPELDIDLGLSDPDPDVEGKEGKDVDDGRRTPNSNSMTLTQERPGHPKQYQLPAPTPAPQSPPLLLPLQLQPQQQPSVLHTAIQRWYHEEYKVTRILPYLSCASRYKKRCPMISEETRAQLRRLQAPFVDFGYEIQRFCMDHVEGYDLSNIIRKIQQCQEGRGDSPDSRDKAPLRDSGIGGMGEDCAQRTRIPDSRPRLSLPPQLQLPPIDIGASTVDLEPISDQSSEPSPILRLPNALAIQDNTPPLISQEERQVHRQESLGLLQGNSATTTGPARTETKHGSCPRLPELGLPDIEASTSPSRSLTSRTTAAPKIYPPSIVSIPPRPCPRSLTEQEEDQLIAAVNEAAYHLSSLVKFLVELRDAAENACFDPNIEHLPSYDAAYKFARKYERRLNTEMLPLLPGLVNFTITVLSEKGSQIASIVDGRGPAGSLPVPKSAAWSLQAVKETNMSGALSSSLIHLSISANPAAGISIPRSLSPPRTSPRDHPKTRAGPSRPFSTTATTHTTHPTHAQNSKVSKPFPSSGFPRGVSPAKPAKPPSSSTFLSRLARHGGPQKLQKRKPRDSASSSSSSSLSLRLARAQFSALNRLSSYPALDAITCRSLPRLEARIERLLALEQARLSSSSVIRGKAGVEASEGGSNLSPLNEVPAASKRNNKNNNRNNNNNQSNIQAQAKGVETAQQANLDSLLSMHALVSSISAKIAARRAAGRRISAVDTEEKIVLDFGNSKNKSKTKTKTKTKTKKRPDDDDDADAVPHPDSDSDSDSDADPRGRRTRCATGMMAEADDSDSEQGKELREKQEPRNRAALHDNGTWASAGFTTELEEVPTIVTGDCPTGCCLGKKEQEKRKKQDEAWDRVALSVPEWRRRVMGKGKERLMKDRRCEGEGEGEGMTLVPFVMSGGGTGEQEGMYQEEDQEDQGEDQEERQEEGGEKGTEKENKMVYGPKVEEEKKKEKQSFVVVKTVAHRVERINKEKKEEEEEEEEEEEGEDDNRESRGRVAEEKERGGRPGDTGKKKPATKKTWGEASCIRVKGSRR